MRDESAIESRLSADMRTATEEWTHEALMSLAERHLNNRPNVILDVGDSGSFSRDIKWKLGAGELIVFHPDEERLDSLQDGDVDGGVDLWQVGSVSSIASSVEKADLFLFLDVAHEIYSLHGRPSGSLYERVHHELGRAHVECALEQAAELIPSGGAIMIATDIVVHGKEPWTLRPQTDEARRFLKEMRISYRSVDLGAVYDEEEGITLAAEHLATLLAQWDRGEREMVHAFMDLEEWRVLLHDLGFELRIEIGTSPLVTERRAEAFGIESGGDRFPDTRMALLGIKR
ncbi:MAG TPA: hypothetical protein ENK43_07100 [Planctomycetes bacterium]|nr:hypothetical protein [Planctomycetota bacterium]